MTVVIYAWEKLYDFEQGKHHTIWATKIEESICVDDLEITYSKRLDLETIIVPKDYIHSVTFDRC